MEQDWQMPIYDEDSRNFNKENLQGYVNFNRPYCDINPEQDLYLMNIDISSSIYQQQHNGIKQPIPKIKIFAVNEMGNSVEVKVKGFVPYFYSEIPRNMQTGQDEDQILQDIRLKINEHFAKLQEQKRRDFDKKPVNFNAIVKIQIVQKKNIRNYVPDEFIMNRFWKIQTSTPNVINPLRKMFEEEMLIDGLVLPRQTFQSNIPYVLRFMIDKNIVGMGWMKISKYQFTICKKAEIQSESTCQIELQCDQSAIQAMPMNQQWSKIPPIRILSFDIECAAEHGFPDPQKHQVIQIACVCKTSTKQVEDYKVVFSLHDTARISGVHVKSSQTENQVLQNFQKLILSYDPDFIVGYNMINFDLYYLLERANTLNMKNYGIWGRSLGFKSKVRNSSYSSKVMGNRDTKEINIDGRIQLDMMIHMHRDHKLTSYRLNNVAYHFLKDQKEDVHHTEIYKLYKKDKQSRKRLAIYCLKDAELPLRLMQKLCCLYNYSQMARVTGVPINYLLNRGQQIKVMSQLLRKAKQHQYISPTQRVTQNNNEIAYQGAYVLDPMVGFYEDPIATLDFASLYPSIMIAHNLCYTTLIRNDQIIHYKLETQDITETPGGHKFVKPGIREGLLPEILKQLLAARKRAKLELKKTTDPMMKNVLQGRQLALKISANSVYGFTGALVGQLPCLPISSSVTGFGRQMIENTRDYVKKNYEDSQVIYGDTDSVMVRFKLNQSSQGTKQQKIREAMKYGKQAADTITNNLFENMNPIKLQFEKVYCPYLLMAKKRYAGVYYSKPQIHDKIDKKGIESVRRDNCVLIREMLDKVIELILCQSDREGASEYIKETVSRLVQNKIDISKLVITKAITKKAGEQDSDKQQDKKKTKGKDSKGPNNVYKVKQAHVQLAEKMKKRDKNVSVHIGDRISYVMVNGVKGSSNYDNAQDPILVLNDDLPIDYDYYINRQLKPPLQRLLKHTKIIENFEALFQGEHTKSRYLPKVSKNNFMAKFVEKRQTCINCPVTTENDLCQTCEPKRIEIVLRKEAEYKQMLIEYRNMWQECVNCQGSQYSQILCQNTDCPIFFRRIKIKNDIAQKKQINQRLEW